MPDRRTIPRLMLVTDAHRARWPLPELVAAAVAGGVDAVYLRGGWGAGAGNLGVGDAGDALQVAGIAPTVGVARELRARIGDDAALLINGSAELASHLGTGLHLRERDPLSTEARQLLGPAMLIGRSVHSPEAVTASAGVDFVLAGHVFPSASKPGKPPLGLAGLSAIIAAAPCPVLAIGGITADRVAEVIHAGAHGVAVIGAIAEAHDPRAAAAALRAALDRAVREQKQQEDLPVSNETSAPNGRPALEIVVNGKTVAVAPGQTVHDFLAARRLADTMAIVERNGEIVPRADYGATELETGDSLEVVHAVGGG